MMPLTPKLAVIICTHNRRSLLAACLEALRNQSCSSLSNPKKLIKTIFRRFKKFFGLIRE